MKRIICAIASVLFLCLAAPVIADQVKVNIVYPINGATYPVTDPAPGVLKSAYFTSSFSVTCSGGPHKVEWGFDNLKPAGSSIFYDQTSIQFVHKLPGGSHELWVKADCAANRVKFWLGK